jgi:anti-repressor protein
MNQLVKIGSRSIGQEVRQTVNARELHEFLGIDSKFADWMKRQIERARLVENRDYVTVSQKQEAVGNRGLTVEYHLTIDSGKAIGMMSATNKGFEIRDYFLECERQALTSQPQLPQTFSQALMLAARLQEDVERKTLQIQQDVPKVEFFNRVASMDRVWKMKEVSTMLGIGNNTLLAILRREKVFMGLLVGKNSPYWNLPYQMYKTRKLFDTRTQPIERGNVTMLKQVAVTTAEGILWLHRKLIERGEISSRQPVPAVYEFQEAA